MNELDNNLKVPYLPNDIPFNAEQTQWLGLKIINHKPSAKTATVEFIAFYQDNPIGQLHEQSRFIQEDEQWYYTDGDILEPIKLSRNEACFCGSGKKLKRCHML